MTRCAAVLSVTGILAAAGCHRSAPAPVATTRLQADRAGLERGAVGHESRFVLPAAQRQFALEVPAATKLEIGFGVGDEAWTANAGAVDFIVTARAGEREERLLAQRVERPDPAHPNAWHDAVVDLAAFGGRSVTLSLTTEASGDEPAATRRLWSDPRLVPAEAPPRPAGAPPNLILISIDTLRADHLGCYGYQRDTSPTIDHLARDGVLFRRTISQSSWTLPAHASLFTGLLPHRHGAVEFGFTTPVRPDLATLAEQLWDAGYQTAAFAGGGFVSLSLGFDQGFDVFGDPRLPGLRERPFANAVARARAWLETTPARPFFLFLHTYEVHVPYLPPPPYNTMFDPDYTGPYKDGVTPKQAGELMKSQGAVPARDVEHLRALYDGSIRSMDASLAAFLAFLDQRGLSDSTCVVLTADHGEQFLEHGNLFHHHARVYEELLRIPLIIRCPGIGGGRVVDTPVALVDVMPTLLELAAAPVPSGLDGHSLLPTLRAGDAPAERPIVSECAGSAGGSSGTARAVRSHDRKLITSTVPGQPPTELFDLASDPGERHDTSATDTDTVAQLRATLAGILGGDGARVLTPAAAPDAAARERLRALGYGP